MLRQYLFALVIMFLGLFSFNAMAQTCIQQGGNIVGCVQPIGMTYGNSTIGYFSSELAAVQAQGQYYLQNQKMSRLFW